MRSLVACCLLSALTLPSAAQTPTPAPAAKPAVKPAAAAAATPSAPSEDDKTFYAVGLSIWKSLAVFELTPAETEQVMRGLREAAAGKPSADVTLEAYAPKVDALVRARQQQRLEKEKARSTEYLAKAAKEPGAVQSESGLIYTEVAAGSGEAPKASDTVKVHYRGTLTDGTEFDSSYKRNEPAQFPLSGVIKCWTEGLQKMKVGGKGKLVCPASIAYGDRGRPSIPGGATLLFDVELIEIVPPPAPPAAAASPAPTPAPTAKP